MDKTSLNELNAYNDDANGLLLGVARDLTEEEMNRPASPSHGTALGLLRHMLDAEAYFLSLCMGASYAPEQEALLSLPELVTKWGSVAANRRAYLGAVSEQELQEQVGLTFGKGLTFTRAQLMLQSLVHSVHHRGELSIVMTGLGHPLPTMDIILHFARQSDQHWS